MTAVTIPAPLWRRLAAAFYDALLLAAAWLVAAYANEVVRRTAGLPLNNLFLRGLLFAVGLGIFGWQWTHGGHTVGMRAWRLQVRREDGAPLRWPVAAVRYTGMLLCWMVALTPVLLAVLPARLALPHRDLAMASSIGLSLVALLLFYLDARRRAPHDRLTNTEVVQLPRG